MSTSKWTFKKWWAERKEADLPADSLLNDIFGDRDFPDTEDKEILLRYLQKRKVDAATINSFEAMWNTYRAIK